MGSDHQVETPPSTEKTGESPPPPSSYPGHYHPHRKCAVPPNTGRSKLTTLILRMQHAPTTFGIIGRRRVIPLLLVLGVALGTWSWRLSYGSAVQRYWNDGSFSGHNGGYGEVGIGIGYTLDGSISGARVRGHSTSKGPAHSHSKAVEVLTNAGDDKEQGRSSGRKGRPGDGGGRNTTPWPPVSPTPMLPLEASLVERLEVLKSVPIREGADWVTWNMETCPWQRISKNRNKDLLTNSHLLWSSLNSTEIGLIRQDMIDFLEDELYDEDGRLRFLLLDPKIGAAGHVVSDGSGTGTATGRSRPHLREFVGEGRGLVFSAGNADTFDRVITTLKMLRTYFDTPKEMFPAEVFSFEGEADDLPETKKKELEELGARLRTVDKNAISKGDKKKNYQIKAAAIVESSFREVLYLDSDNIPTRPLSEIFDSKGFKRLGVMFWPDYWKTTADNPMWQIIGVQCRDEWEQEAGQILIDKGRHLDALLLAEWMLKQYSLFFFLSDGDKDIFRFAFLALRKKWAVPGRYVSAAGLPSNTPTGRCGHTMLQFDHLGRPWGVHENLLKQIPSGVGKGYSWGRQVAMKDPVIEGEDPFNGGDIDCDMLANAKSDGSAIAPAPPAIRRRAALERGIKSWLHGGWISAICADMSWEDPRSDEEIDSDNAFIDSISAGDGDGVPGPASGIGQKVEDKDYGFTRSPGGFQVNWTDPLVESMWSDDPVLKDFEDRFFEIGGKVNGWT